MTQTGATKIHQMKEGEEQKRKVNISQAVKACFNSQRKNPFLL